MKNKALFLIVFFGFTVNVFSQEFKFDTVKVIDSMFIPGYMHIDKDYNVYTANVTSGLTKLYKLDSNLNFICGAALHPTNGGLIRVRDITTDSKKNIYWSVSLENGCVSFTDTTYCTELTQIIIIKFDSLGNYIWSREMGNYNNFAWAIDCDENDDIYISGYSFGSDYFYLNDSVYVDNAKGKSFVIKLDAEGNIVRYIFYGSEWTVSARIYFRDEKIYIPFGYAGTFDLDTSVVAPSLHFYAGILVLDTTFNYIDSKIIKGYNVSPFYIAFDESDNLYFTGRFSDTLYLLTDTFFSPENNSSFLLKLNKKLDIVDYQILYNHNSSITISGKIEYKNKELYLSLSSGIGDTIFWNDEFYYLNGPGEFIFVLDSNFNKKQVIYNHGQYFDIYDFKVIKRNNKIFIYDLGVFSPNTYFNDQLAIDSSYYGGCFISVFSKDIPVQKPPVENPYLKIYPNPVQDLLFIDFFDYDITFMQIKIYNLLGQLIITENYNIVSEENKFVSDLSNLQTGIYIVFIKTNKFTISKKIIKQ